MGLGFGFVVAKVFGLHGTGTKAFVERIKKKRVFKLIYTFFFFFFLGKVNILIQLLLLQPYFPYP